MKPSQQWIDECLKWRGEVLTGPDAHWCMDWDGLPVDARTPEYDCCLEKKTFWGRIVNWFFMRKFNRDMRKVCGQ